MMLWSGQILSQVADKVFLVLLITLMVDYRPPPCPGKFHEFSGDGRQYPAGKFFWVQQRASLWIATPRNTFSPCVIYYVDS